MNMLRLAGIVEESIVDGPGLRMTVFVQGCHQDCPGCQNPETHPMNGGEWKDAEDVLELFKSNPLLQGITFSGGEPFLQPAVLAWLAMQVHALGKDVISFSGYTLEQLLDMSLQHSAILDLLDQLDALVDGPYIEALKSMDLLYRGSSNQRYLKWDDIMRLRCEWKISSKKKSYSCFQKGNSSIKTWRFPKWQ